MYFVRVILSFQLTLTSHLCTRKESSKVLYKNSSYAHMNPKKTHFLRIHLTSRSLIAHLILDKERTTNTLLKHNKTVTYNQY